MDEQEEEKLDNNYYNKVIRFSQERENQKKEFVNRKSNRSNRSKDSYKLNKFQQTSKSDRICTENANANENRSVSNRSNHSSIIENIVGFSKETSTKENLSHFFKANEEDKVPDSAWIIPKVISSSTPQQKSKFENFDEYATPINSSVRFRESPINYNKIKENNMFMDHIQEEERSSIQSHDS